MLRKPRTFMVTTPESLYLLVTAAKSRESAALGRDPHRRRDPRHGPRQAGSHLALTMERLTTCAAGRPPGSGCRPPSGRSRPWPSSWSEPAEANHAGPTRSCARSSTRDTSATSTSRSSYPTSSSKPSRRTARWTRSSTASPTLVADHQTTLVFVNTRRLAERLAHQLGERLGEDVVAAHHGSLSKDRRHRVERRLRAGDLKALVATASLELGIDVGPVELVCQIGSPRSIATFLQRVGRSNHTRHGTPRGRLYPLTRDELVECTALMAAIRAGRLDALHPPVAPLDILAQQIVAETGAEEWRTDDLYELFTPAYPYRDLSREDFDAAVDQVSDGIMTGRGRGPPGSITTTSTVSSGAARGPVCGAHLRRRHPRDLRHAGDRRARRHLHRHGQRRLGHGVDGRRHLPARHQLLAHPTGHGRRGRVVDAGDAPPTVPFWTGEAPARTAELSEEVSRLRAESRPFLERDDPAGATAWLIEDAGIPREAAALIVATSRPVGPFSEPCPPAPTLVMERFFDDADGMQLVIHSPLGGRINRAMGYSLRKKFCVGFNFELQAAASDDAVVISLGPHHSFPLTDVQRWLTPENIRETLTQAVLDQPAFQSRWRWNLNRALIVLRMRNGKRNPPPIQRMESDDMMAALFPDAAACQENVSGPAEIPDHPLVQQTIHDTLTEGMDVDGLIALWQRLGEGSVRFHHVDTTEPSALAHEILTARPYAFLDDGELPDRRTHNVRTRRGLPLDPSQLGKLTPEAIATVQAELTPNPQSADELHDLLRDVVLLRARDAWQPLFCELVERGRAARICDELGERWHAVESSEAVQVLLSGAPSADSFPEQVATAVVRGHLELRSPATAAELETETGISATNIKVALLTLESEGSAIQGRFTDASLDRGDNVAGPGQQRSTTQQRSIEWCSRRLLARMHSLSRSHKRKSVQSVSPQDFVRFLTRWQHVAPGTRLSGPAGLGRALEQLQGWEAAVAAWEPDLLAARLRDYQPLWLDRMCHDGELQWLRLSPRSMDDPNKVSGGPSKATPVSLVFRDDLGWLLRAVRGDAEAPKPGAGAVTEIIEALDTHGARFLAELATDTGRLATDIESGLWDGVARGLLTADGFEAIRALTGAKRRPDRRERALSKLRRSGVRSAHSAGRWSVVPPAPVIEDRDELVEALADQLLQRWGVLFYDLVAHENLSVPWRDLQWALRRLEDRGLIKGGRFVTGFSGEQFALPEAVQGLNKIRKEPASGRTVTVCGSDPLNLTGVILAGERIPPVAQSPSNCRYSARSASARSSTKRPISSSVL